MDLPRPLPWFRTRRQTASFNRRLRRGARRAGGRAFAYVRRSHAFKPLPAYRRIRAGTLPLYPGRAGACSVFLGDGVEIGTDATFAIREGSLFLGDGCSIGSQVHVEVDGDVVVRDGARLAPGVVVRPRGGRVEIHPGAEVGRYATIESRPGARTVVGRRSALGPGATLLAGAELGQGAAAGAGQLVQGRVAGPRRPVASGLLVSVVVSTKDRRAFLAGLLDSLDRQTLPGDRFELVIVDNGSSDDTLATLRAAARRTRFRTRVLRREPPGGPARGRNAGWREARADVVAFTDDDCRPAPEWLEEGLRIMGEGEPGIVQGRTFPDPARIGYLGPFDTSQRVEWESGVYETCNIFYVREALERAGGFSEDIPVPAGEDTEVAWRAKALGYASRFAPEAVVYHAVHPGSLRGYARRFRQWADVPRVAKRTPDVRRAFFLRVFWSRFHAWFLLAIAGGGAAAWAFAAGTGWWPWPLVLCLPYARFLVRAARETTPPLRRLARAPRWVAKDVIEVGTLLAGSVRHRRLLL